LTGNGIPLNFGSYNVAGSYTVYAVNPITGCSADMNGVLDFDIDPMPVEFALSSLPTDGQYCEGEEGVRLKLDLSTTGVEYWVYRGASVVGEPYIGDSEAMTFGPFTEEGTYRVMAAGGGGGCLVPMDGVVEIRMNRAPDKFDVVADNDGRFCPGSEGVEIRITGQEAGVEYQLFFNGDAESPKIIGGDNPALPLSFGKYNEAGEYVVIGASGAGCEAEIGSITINIDDTPEVFTLTGDAGFCEGTNPEFTLYGSEAGVEYELYLDGVPMGITVMGTGAPIVFTGTIEGEYSVWASLTTAHNVCKVEMDGNIIVTEKLLPDVTGVTIEDEAGTGTGCDNGLVISVNNPQAGVRYELYFVDNGTYSYTDNFVVGAEDGAAVAFPNPVIDGGGEYIVQAMLDGCPAFIEPKFEIAIDDVPRRFALIGSGDVCEGEDGADLWLSGSEDNVSYELWARHGVSPVQTVTFPHADFDTGEAFPFNKVVEEGAYYVRAVSGNDASCAVTTYEDLEVRFHKLPDAYQFTGAQVFCGTAEGEGAVLKLNDSEAGVVYSLMRRVEGDFTLFVDSKDGNDGPLEFSEVFTEGIYRVYARDTLTGCTSSMNGAVEVEQRPAPSEALTITANDYCSDGSTSELTVAGHETDVFYHLYSPDASGSLIQTLVGTGGTEDLVFEGLQEGNLYTLYASWEDEACMVALSLDISVSLLDSPEVPVLDPIVENPTCAGEAYVSVINAEDGVVYELINIDLGTRFEIVKGVDEPVLWDYTFLDNNGLLSSFLMVRAFNPETLCAVDLEEAIRVDIKAAPADFLLESNGASITKDVPVVKCSNAPLDISIPVSEDGVLYRLYRHSASGGVDRLATLEGNGAEISFSSVTQWPEGDYYVEATFASSGCVGSVAEFTIQLLYSPHHSVPLVLHYTDGLLVVEEKVLNATYTLYFNGEAHPLAPIQVNVLTDEVAWEVGESGTYYVTAQSPAGCIDESNTITISDVTPPVDEYRLVDQVLEYCSGDAGGIDVVLTGTTAGVYYELVKLDDDNPEVIQIKKGITDGGDVVFNGVEGTHRYSIGVDGSDDKFEQGTFEVTAHATPAAFVLSRGGAVGNHEITLTGSENGVWYWLIRNGDIDFEELPRIGSGSQLNFGTVDKPGDYFVMAIGSGGCEALMDGMANIYQSELVAVNDTLYLSPDDLAATIDLAENDRYSFIGGLDRYGDGDGNLRFTIVRPANSGAEISIDEFTGALSYSKLPSFFGQDFLEYKIENLDVPGRESGIGRVVIMVGNKDFNENQSFLLPNAFSPNGDDINEKFIISGLGETEESSLEVFNRWGTIVYRSEGKRYDNSWDGTSNMGTMVSIGKELPSGVYFYVFEVVKNIEEKIQKRRYNGFVELRR
ncbi:MAG: gliding motility-associated C-terminal domain-containing protein, partial [Bacteroidales bacterium]|nr:gliding motility-associated C-terminal domain-containing protein [Bacteroidales bacterium]